MARRYTPEQHAWIAERYPTMTNAELFSPLTDRIDPETLKVVTEPL